MSWLLSLLISATIGLITFAGVVVVLRRQRRQMERLLTEFGSQQLITNKRITEIMLQHQKRMQKNEAAIDTVKLVAENSRRDSEYALTQAEFLMRFTGALEAAEAVAAEDEDGQPRASKRPKYLN